jgi:deoxyribose-phosphate aldolase
MKNFKFTPYPFSQSQVAERIAQYSQQPLQFFDEQTAFRFILNCIDLTTLEGADNTSKIEDLCNKVKSFKSVSKKISNPASVCVYPPFVAQAKKMLHGSGVRVASVAGAFPSGQSPLFVKLAEVKYAVDEGADDIDIVISRGKFLESNYEEVSEEIVAIKKCAIILS